MTERLHVVVRGQVQGVGFRYSTVHQAHALALNGFVRNAHDGSVEAEFEGERDALEAMLEWCRKGSTFSVVDAVEPTWDSGEPRYSDFTVRF